MKLFVNHLFKLYFIAKILRDGLIWDRLLFRFYGFAYFILKGYTKMDIHMGITIETKSIQPGFDIFQRSQCNDCKKIGF